MPPGNNSNQNNQQGSGQQPQQQSSQQQSNPFPHIALPGLSADPNPKVVVKSINPPITPDQVVSMAEAPSAVQLPEIKLQNIKIPPVKNKTVQGHLKAIEAKMIATEKLMKDIVKLQKLQIHTEKELHQRRRELYQNTFEEYLLDKTIDFQDPDDPDCTCINLPKKPPGGGLPPFGGGRRGNRPRNPNPGPVTVTAPETTTEPGTTTEPSVPEPNPPLEPVPPIGPERRRKPQFEIPNWWLYLAPFFNPGYKTAKGPTPQEMENFLATGSYDGVPKPDPVTGVIPVQSPKSPTIGETIASNVVKGFTNPTPIDEALGFAPGTLPEGAEESISMAMMVSPGGFGVKGVSAIPSLASRLLAPPAMAGSRLLTTKFPKLAVGSKVPPSAVVAKERLLKDPLRGVVPQVVKPQTASTPFRGVSDAQRIANAQGIAGASSRGPAGGYGANIATQNYSNIFRQAAPTADDTAKIMESFTGRPIYEAPSEIISNTSLNTRILERLFNQPSTTRESTRSAAQRVFGGKETKGVTEISGVGGKKASGGINDLNLYSAESQEYFRNLSRNMEIPKFGGGGIFDWIRSKLSPQGLARGLKGVRAGFTGMNAQGFDAMMKGEGYKASSKPQILGRGAYSAPTLRGAQRYAGATGSLGGAQTPGGVVNSIVPGNAPRINFIEPQSKVSPDIFNKGRDLATKLQQGRWPNSARANMLRSQIVRGSALSKSFIKPNHPSIMLLQLIADELINPRSTAVYDQISGPNAYYNAPGYKGPKPSDALENAQDSMRSGSDNSKPEIMPLPPDYIKIPGKPQPKPDVGIDIPGIDMPSSIFTRSSVYLD